MFMKSANIKFSPDDYVAGLYRSMLGREPDPEGARGYVAALRKGASPVWVLAEIQNSAEYRARIAPPMEAAGSIAAAARCCQKRRLLKISTL
jgi:hypothetical protein